MIKMGTTTVKPAGASKVYVGEELVYLRKTVGPSAIVSVDDASPLDAEGLVAQIEPVQDLHGYDHPWPAGGGKNLIPLVIDKLKVFNKDKTWNGDTATESGISFEFHTNSDGAVNAIVASGTYSKQVNVALGTIKLKADTDYIINGVPTTPTWQTFQLYVTANGNKYASVSGTRFTVTEDGEYPVYLSIYGPISIFTFHPMIRLATETDDTFAPYSNVCPISGWTGVEVKHSGADVSDPATLPVAFPASAGTVYGGYVDLVNGKLVVDRAEVDLGTLSWGGTGATYFTTDVNISVPSATQWDTQKGMCSIYTIQPMFYVINQSARINNSIAWYSNYIRIADFAYTDSASFKAAMSGVQLVYELATPITYDIDPVTLTLLRGDNNVWVDTGDTTLTYQVDIPLYKQHQANS